MANTVIYWIRLEEHLDPLTQGYIGVAKNLDKRILQHRRAAEKGKHVNFNLQKVLTEYPVIIDIIFSGEEKLCYLKEKELRPRYRIGWNISPGGDGGSTTLGMKMSDEFRSKRSEFMRGNKIALGNHKSKSAEHRRKMSLAHQGIPKTEEQKRLQSQIMKGRKQSPDHVEKKRLASLGKKRSEETKKKISTALLGLKHSPEHIEKIRLAKLGKKRGPYKKKNVDL